MQPSLPTKRISNQRAFRIIAALVILVVVGILCWPRVFDSEPVYHGLPVSYWLEQGDVNAFRAMGPRGMEYLGRVAEFEEAKLPRKADEFLRRVGLARFANLEMADTRMARRDAAFKILSHVGRDAEPALPSFLRIYFRPIRESDDRYWDLELVSFIKPFGLKLGFIVPKLLKDLIRADNVSADVTTSADARSWADERVVADIDLLAAIGPRANPAVPTLRQWTSAMQVPAGEKQLHAAVALWNIDRETNLVVNAISNQLRFHDDRCYGALAELEEASSPIQPLAPALEKGLRHPDWRVRHLVKVQLRQIDPERLEKVARELNSHQAEVLQQHIELLQSTNVADRLNAMKAIRFFGPPAPEAATVLAGLLDRCLARASEVLTKLPNSLNSLESAQQECIAAVLALSEINDRGRETVSALVDNMRLSPQPSQYSYRALANLGKDAAEALPYLRQLLSQHDNRDVLGRFLIAQTICRIDPRDSEALEIVKVAAINPGQLSPNGADMVRSSAAVTLWKIGMNSKLPVGQLRSVIGATNDLRINFLWAIDLLGEIGPPAHDALPELEKFLRPDSVLLDAAIAIRKIDPEEAKRLELPGLLIICPDKF